MEQKSAFESFELEVGEDIKGFLKETCKWTYFLSILGFIGISLMLIGGIAIAFSGSMLSWGGSDTAYQLGYASGIAIVYIILALVYLFPVLYLFKFSSKMKSALKLNNSNDFKLAFSNLKSHYKYMGIFTIIIISLYILIFIGGMITSTSF